MRKAPAPQIHKEMNRMTRELSKLGGVPKGSASSAILLPAGSKISNTDPTVPRKPMSRRISPEAAAIFFADLIHLIRSIAGEESDKSGVMELVLPERATGYELKSH
jgi:hypothetical protein